MICLVDRADHTKFVYRSGDLVMPLYCVHLLITLINLPTLSSEQDKNNLHDNFANNASSYCHNNYSNS